MGASGRVRRTPMAGNIMTRYGRPLTALSIACSTYQKRTNIPTLGFLPSCQVTQPPHHFKRSPTRDGVGRAAPDTPQSEPQSESQLPITRPSFRASLLASIHHNDWRITHLTQCDRARREGEKNWESRPDMGRQAAEGRTPGTWPRACAGCSRWTFASCGRCLVWPSWLQVMRGEGFNGQRLLPPSSFMEEVAMVPGVVVARPPASSAEEANLSVVVRGERLMSAGWTTLSKCCSIAKLHQAAHVAQLDLTGNQVSASSARLHIIHRAPSRKTPTLSSRREHGLHWRSGAHEGDENSQADDGTHGMPHAAGRPGCVRVRTTSFSHRGPQPAHGASFAAGNTEYPLHYTWCIIHYVHSDWNQALSSQTLPRTLTHLDLSYNALAALPTLRGLPHLRILNVAHNRLQDVRGAAECPTLTVVRDLAPPPRLPASPLEQPSIQALASSHSPPESPLNSFPVAGACRGQPRAYTRRSTSAR